MKKILYIAISSQTGGVPKHILNALKENRDYEITVAIPRDGDYYEWMKMLAVQMLDYPLKPYSFRSLLRLRNYVKSQGITLVHSHGKGAGMYGRVLKILCPSLKVVHTFHGIYLEKYGKITMALYVGIEHLLKHFTDVFICVSESEKLEAARLGFIDPKKTVVISNGVDMESYIQREVDWKIYQNEFGLKENSYVIGCVARLEKMKGHRYLLEAFEQVIACHSNCILILVGDGPDRESIKHLVAGKGLSNHVVFAGSRHDIPKLLHLFNIFVSCSLKEGMPYTLLEALASGTLVVATDVIGNRDIIKHRYNGLLAHSENSLDIGEKIIYAIEHQKECEEWSRNGITTVAEKFTLHKSVVQLFEVYKNQVN